MNQWRSCVGIYKIILVLNVSLVTATNLVAQDNRQAIDRVYLKSGITVMGKVDTVNTNIVRVTEEKSKRFFDVKKSEIKFILFSNGKYLSFDEDNTQVNIEPKKVQVTSSPENKFDSAGSHIFPKSFRILGGVSLPVGDFSSATSSQAGFAKVGYSFGLEFASQIAKGFELGAVGNLNIHPINEVEAQRQFRAIASNGSVKAGVWVLIGIMAGVGFSTPVSPSIDVYGKGFIGELFGNIPKLTFISDSITAIQSSASATAIEYGFGVGIILDNQIDLDVRYLTAAPRYELTITSENSSTTSDYKQPSTTVRLSIGYIINIMRGLKGS